MKMALFDAEPSTTSDMSTWPLATSGTVAMATVARSKAAICTAGPHRSGACASSRRKHSLCSGAIVRSIVLMALHVPQGHGIGGMLACTNTTAAPTDPPCCIQDAGARARAHTHTHTHTHTHVRVHYPSAVLKCTGPDHDMACRAWRAQNQWSSPCLVSANWAGQDTCHENAKNTQAASGKGMNKQH
jgi:hypothetical protein